MDYGGGVWIKNEKTDKWNKFEGNIVGKFFLDLNHLN
jgi:hypothetical protein